MEQRRETSPASFCGTYEIILVNGSFILPTLFLEKLEAESPMKKVFFFFPKREGLQLYSEQGLHKFAEKIRMSQHDQMTALRLIGKWSPEGEIQIPARLLQMYGFLHHEIVTMIGADDHIELWKTDHWKQHEGSRSEELAPYRAKVLEELDKLNQ